MEVYCTAVQLVELYLLIQIQKLLVQQLIGWYTPVVYLLIQVQKLFVQQLIGQFTYTTLLTGASGGQRQRRTVEVRGKRHQWRSGIVEVCGGRNEKRSVKVSGFKGLKSRGGQWSSGVEEFSVGHKQRIFKTVSELKCKFYYNKRIQTKPKEWQKSKFKVIIII